MKRTKITKRTKRIIIGTVSSIVFFVNVWGSCWIFHEYSDINHWSSFPIAITAFAIGVASVVFFVHSVLD